MRTFTHPSDLIALDHGCDGFMKCEVVHMAPTFTLADRQCVSARMQRKRARANLQLLPAISIHHTAQHPSVSDDIDQAADPQPKKHIFPQEFQLVCLTEPQGLCAHPYDQIQQTPAPGYREARDQQWDEEEIPQEVLHTKRTFIKTGTRMRVYCGLIEHEITYLRRANLVENHKNHCLHEPRKDEVVPSPPEHQAGAQGQDHLR
ncbi:hypothetical protein EW146_g5536 [Bondarzewia mesenterica]|uniref:Uncharacterized protein n=1 Tax=Bondarzewia mesenterica TaxID=1095465 RepID=A0A4S4LR62_9AGAM|nr:hypothetical protein EW146_g5536 [Bondarzewia mesenterica]